MSTTQEGGHLGIPEAKFVVSTMFLRVQLERLQRLEIESDGTRHLALSFEMKAGSSWGRHSGFKSASPLLLFSTSVPCPVFRAMGAGKCEPLKCI